MMKIRPSRIAVIVLFILGTIGCSQSHETPTELPISAQQDFISIESRSCDRITAILPGRGRYDGISLEFVSEIKAWTLKFEHVPYRNERPSPIGLLTLEEIAEISSLIINRGECVNPPYATRRFGVGDKFLTSIDWWLVEDLYTTGLEAARLIPENYDNLMEAKHLSHKDVNEAVRAKGFIDNFCLAFEKPEHSCDKIGCEYSENPKTCEPKLYSIIRAHFSSDVVNIPTTEICKVENCGLEKESKFHFGLIKL